MPQLLMDGLIQEKEQEEMQKRRKVDDGRVLMESRFDETILVDFKSFV
jgi:hypothetical protein